MKQRVVEPQAATSWEPWAASLTVSVVLHILVVMGAMGSSWLWRASVFEPASSYRVALVDAPLSLRNPSPPPAAAPPPPKPEPKPEPAPEAAAVKTPLAPQPAPEIKQTPSQPIQNKPVPAATPTPDPKRPTAKPIKKTPQAAVKPQTATSSEAESALAALRQRQAEQEELKRQRTEAAAQQAAAQRVAALRDQVAEENTVGAAAVRAVGLRQVRLTAYQERVRTQIIDAWILPIPPEQSRDLQATVFFRVVRDGRVEQLHLVQASGHPLFDASLIRAIKRASPLPVLPADYPGEMLEVEMRFRARESSE